MVILYTQPACYYCSMMKKMLDELDIRHTVIDIQKDNQAKAFLKNQGHRTVPQLYVDTVHINKKNTEEYTSQELYTIINEVVTTVDDYDNQQECYFGNRS